MASKADMFPDSIVRANRHRRWGRADSATVLLRGWHGSLRRFSLGFSVIFVKPCHQTVYSENNSTKKALGLFGFDFLQLFGGEMQESVRIPPNGLRFCEFCSPQLLYAPVIELKHNYNVERIMIFHATDSFECAALTIKTKQAQGGAIYFYYGGETKIKWFLQLIR
jgi:hypothetical protein